MGCRNKTGFSLVEIMIGCIMLSILLVPVFSMLSRGNVETSLSKSDMLAQQYAANLLAYVTSLDFDNSLNSAAKGTSHSVGDIDWKNIVAKNNATMDLSVPDGQQFVTKINIPPDSIVSHNGHDYKLVTVNVSWKVPGDNTATRSILLADLMYR